MATGKPAIPTLRSVDLREVQGAVNAIRERLRALDELLGTVQLQAQQSSNLNTQINNIIGALRSQLAALLVPQSPNRVFAGPSAGNPAIPTFRALVWDDLPLPSELPSTSAIDGSELVAIERAGEMLYTTLQAIADLSPGGDVVLYDNEGRAMLTGSGQAILVR